MFMRLQIKLSCYAVRETARQSGSPYPQLATSEPFLACGHAFFKWRAVKYTRKMGQL
jgi:hypothetical protein